MLIEFSITNFLSFKDKTTFSMIASQDKTLENNYNKVGGDKLLKLTAIYGANASGKSNLFKALNMICEAIRNSNVYNINATLPIIPFKLDDESSNKHTEFEIKFYNNDIKYIYGFEADYRKIYSEYLFYYPNGRPVKIFERKNVDEYSFNYADERILNDIKTKNTENKFFVSTATNWNYEKTKPVYDFLTEKMGVVMSGEQLNGYSYNRYLNDENKTLEKFALKFLEKADLNIGGYKVAQENLTDEQYNTIPDIFKTFLPKEAPFFKVNTKHIVNGKEYYLDITEESLGTQLIFSFIPVFKDVLDNGKTILIDEFDKSLHPTIVNFIVNLFNDPDVNKNGAQLIFNTHDTNLLDLELLRRDQVWFTEKNFDTGVSVLYPLDDFSIRKTENIEKGYLLGRYGAVPYITNNYSDLIK